MKTVIKGLIATIIAIAAGILSAGIPSTSTGCIVAGITLVGSVLIYFVQRWSGLFTVTDKNIVGILDFVSAAVIATATAVINYVATIATTDIVNWHAIWSLAGTTFIGFIIAKLKTTNAA